MVREVTNMHPHFLVIVMLVCVFICQADDDLDSDDFDSEDLINSLRGAMDTLFEYVGDENGCVYRCPNGARPKKKPEHKPRSNGCGAFGIKLDTTHMPAIERCCNKHDMCYDMCNKVKDTCDDQFKACLTAICRDFKKHVSRQVFEGCQSSADLMYAATMALGCKPYKESQKAACLCPSTASYNEL